MPQDYSTHLAKNHGMVRNVSTSPSQASGYLGSRYTPPEISPPQYPRVGEVQPRFGFGPVQNDEAALGLVPPMDNLQMSGSPTTFSEHDPRAYDYRNARQSDRTAFQRSIDGHLPYSLVCCSGPPPCIYHGWCCVHIRGMYPHAMQQPSYPYPSVQQQQDLYSSSAMVPYYTPNLALPGAGDHPYAFAQTSSAPTLMNDTTVPNFADNQNSSFGSMHERGPSSITDSYNQLGYSSDANYQAIAPAAFSFSKLAALPSPVTVGSEGSEIYASRVTNYNPMAQASPPVPNAAVAKDDDGDDDDEAEGRKRNASMKKKPAARKARIFGPPNPTDDFLLRSREAGMPYKDIKEKGGLKEAESTLRGRFRALTKAKDRRVRQPRWTGKDVVLLAEAVLKHGTWMVRHGEEEGLDATERRVLRISWRAVGDYIATNGGSYHFGIATCRKKWDEFNSSELPAAKSISQYGTMRET